jgi:hypothetical protein
MKPTSIADNCDNRDNYFLFIVCDLYAGRTMVCIFLCESVNLFSRTVTCRKVHDNWNVELIHLFKKDKRLRYMRLCFWKTGITLECMLLLQFLSARSFMQHRGVCCMSVRLMGRGANGSRFSSTPMNG